MLRKKDGTERLRAEDLEKRAAPLSVYYTEEPVEPAPAESTTEAPAGTEESPTCGVTEEGGPRTRKVRPDRIERR